MTGAGSSAPSTGRARAFFPALDGLRGVAALMVVVHHAGEHFGSSRLFGHAYLAVDFFFMLSGFVVAHAYERRLAGGMPLAAFARARLARLYPLILVGLLLGTVPLLLCGNPLAAVAAALFAEGLFLPLMARSDGLYVLDGVQWSLSFELLANAAHAAVLRKLGLRTLLPLTLAAGLVLIAAAWHYGSLGIGDTVRNAPGGLARVGFTYLAGLSIYRLHLRGLLPTPRVALPWLGVALAAILIGAGLVPPGSAWFAEPAVAILLFPPLLVAGLSAPMPPRWSRVAALGGALSYPLYAVHLPCLELSRLLFMRYPVDPLMGAAATVMLALAVAWAALRLVDRPVQRRLRARATRSGEAPRHDLEPALVQA